MFQYNHALIIAGAIWAQNGSNATIEECSFIANSADDGGAIAEQSPGQTNISISNCFFASNSAGTFGGAIFKRIRIPPPILPIGISGATDPVPSRMVNPSML